MRAAHAMAWAALAVVLSAGAGWAAEEPPLPEGLGAPAPTGTVPAAAEPALPEGLGVPAEEEEPALPEGLGASEPFDEPAEGEPRPGLSLPFDLTGFWELRGGRRTQADAYEDDATLGETRLQLQVEKALEGLTLRLTTDLLYDMVANDPRVDLEEGRGVVDLREAWAALRPTPWMDLKVGRQVLTWGTGDLLFLNDLFPKDWVSFFIGRDAEYLKAPSDALKASVFTRIGNLDIVYTPRFDADRHIEGRRISYDAPMLGRRAGRDAVIEPLRPDTWFADDEIALRAYRTVGGVEVALYGYHGCWKSPAGMDPATRRATFPPLAVTGGSVRGQVGEGIGHAEVAYYDSIDDRPGDDPFVPNSQVRLLAGYEQEVAKDFTAGVQYYVELRTDQDAYANALPPGMPYAPRDRHVVTVRLTQLLMNQNLELGLFTFYSPSDGDAYLRPRVHYKVDDHWAVVAGANVFFGHDPHTFFGQFENNSNLYAGVRYSF